MPMKYPPHPGLSVRYDCLETLGLSVQQGADVLGVHRSTLSRVINARGAISPEMAIRLAKAFGGLPETWLKLQHAYDLAQIAQKAETIDVTPYLGHCESDSPRPSW